MVTRELRQLRQEFELGASWPFVELLQEFELGTSWSLLGLFHLALAALSAVPQCLNPARSAKCDGGGV